MSERKIPEYKHIPGEAVMAILPLSVGAGLLGGICTMKPENPSKALGIPLLSAYCGLVGGLAVSGIADGIGYLLHQRKYNPPRKYDNFQAHTKRFVEELPRDDSLAYKAGRAVGKLKAYVKRQNQRIKEGLIDREGLADA